MKIPNGNIALLSVIIAVCTWYEFKPEANQDVDSYPLPIFVGVWQKRFQSTNDADSINRAIEYANELGKDARRRVEVRLGCRDYYVDKTLQFTGAFDFNGMGRAVFVTHTNGPGIHISVLKSSIDGITIMNGLNPHAAFYIQNVLHIGHDK